MPTILPSCFRPSQKMNRKKSQRIMMEALEQRELLSVTVAANGKSATFTDVDGDLVTVAVTKGTLTTGMFTTAPSGLGEQLQELDLTGVGFSGTNLTISVKQAGSGNGLTNVGYIHAGGNTLGKTIVSGDLGRIDAGTNGSKSGITSLSVFSMGRAGTTSQADGGTLISNIGALGSLAVSTDINQAYLYVYGNIGNVTVGGSLIGGTTVGSGSIRSANGNIGNVFVGQNLSGNSDIVAVNASNSACISAPQGNIGNVTIIGSLIGGAGYASGEFYSGGNMGKVVIGGSMIGGGGRYSGEFDAFNISSAVVNGSLIGGDGDESGSILAGSVGNVTISGSIIGGAGVDSGAIYTKFNDNGNIGNIGKVVIGQNLIGDDFSGTGSAFTGFVEATGKIAGVFVGGSVVAGNNTGGGTLESGSIRAGTTIGAVQINGSLVGSATQDAIISAGGISSSHGGVAISSILIGGRVDQAQILAGYTTLQVADTVNNIAAGTLMATNGGAQIGKITVDGDWIASSVMAGTTAGPDTLPGTNDDASILGAGSGKGSITSITIVGQVFGTAAGGDNFGFVSSKIGAVTISGIKIALTSAKDNIVVGGTDDVTILEV